MNEEPTNKGLYFEEFGYSIFPPAWSAIEHSLEKALEKRGELRLYIVKRLPDARFEILEWISLMIRDGVFRLVYVPDEDHRKIHYWTWIDKTQPDFKGYRLHGEDQFDSRTFFNDIEIAKVIFKDYFDNMKLTDVSLKMMTR